MTKYDDILETIDMKKCGKVVIIKPRVTDHSNCPNCNAHNVSFVAEYHVKCNSCKHEFNAQSRPDYYAGNAKMIDQALSLNNAVLIYTPTKIEYVLTEIYNVYKSMISTGLLYAEIFEPIFGISTFNDKILCINCGYCGNCVTCTKCDEKFILNKNNNLRCPKCNHDKFKDTYISPLPTNNDKPYCPHCMSTKIKYTYFFNKTKCPKCSSTKLKGKTPVTNSVLIIKRRKGAEL